MFSLFKIISHQKTSSLVQPALPRHPLPTRLPDRGALLGAGGADGRMLDAVGRLRARSASVATTSCSLLPACWRAEDSGDPCSS